MAFFLYMTIETPFPTNLLRMTLQHQVIKTAKNIGRKTGKFIPKLAWFQLILNGTKDTNDKELVQLKICKVSTRISNGESLVN